VIHETVTLFSDTTVVQYYTHKYGQDSACCVVPLSSNCTALNKCYGLLTENPETILHSVLN